MIKIMFIIIFVLIISGNEYCYAAVNSLSSMQIIKNQNKQLLSPTIPVMDSLKHTSSIGTVNTPTVDGGIINTTDGILVLHPSITQPPIVKNDEYQLSNSIPIVRSNQKLNVNKSFNDGWATSQKIESILDNVTKTQKMQFVVEQSKILKLPASVAIVPIIESSYQDNAISNKGAVGAWQLMPSTSIEYGLNPYQRTYFIPETKAALMFLKNLHQKFGNWELAFAAYNAGSARVDEALNEQPDATTIDELNLPLETKNYVASIHRINNFLMNIQDNQFPS